MGKYSDIITATQAEDATARARAAGLQAPNVDPDTMGRAMSLADKRGMPPGIVADNLTEYDELQRLDGITDAASASPALARWLGDPNHAKVAEDDTGVLKDIGVRFNSGLLSAKQSLPWLPLPQSAIDLQKDRDEAAKRGPEMRSAPQPSWFSELVGKFQSGWYRGQQGFAISIDPINPVKVNDTVAQGLGYANADEANTASLGVQVADLGRRAEAVDRESEKTTQGFSEIAQAEKTGNTGQIVKAVATNPRAVMSVVAQSLGTTAPQLAMSAAMPASRVVAAVTAGTGSFAAEQGMTVLDVMGDSGVDTSNPAQVTAFLRNKPAMEKARQKALARGVAVGTFDALTAGFAGRLVANSRRTVASIGSRVVGEGLVQAAGGAAGEAAAQLVSEGRITSQSDIILEAAAEVPTFLAEGRGQIAEARRAAMHNADRFDAIQEQRAISDLVNLAAKSKTRQRAATRFESLIRDMTGEGDDTIYLSADGARKLFQSAAADGEPAGAGLESLVDADALREAIATGGEVAIPLAKYVSAVSPEQHASVADQVRLQAGGRHDIPVVSAEQIQADIDAGLAEAAQQEARENGPAGQVYDDVFGQLLSRQDEQLARQNASVVQSVYRNLAERTGTDAWSLYQQFKIRIPGATTDTRARPRGVDIDVDPLLDALRSGKLPTDREIYGDTLVSALHAAGGLRDSGGELANMDAAKLRPGLVNNLAGMTLDDALVWAYQEGFITEAPTQLRFNEDGTPSDYSADAPDINTLLDMLADDLGGNPVYRPIAMNAERASFREGALSLQDELDQLGIDLQKTDNQAVRRALGYANRTLDQSAIDQTQTPEFKVWFGDSKVVDADGKPLVVYHGTTADVDAFDLGFAGSDGVLYSAPAIFATSDAGLASDYAINKNNRNIADAMRAFQRFKNENDAVYNEEYERLYANVKQAFKDAHAQTGRETGIGANVMPLHMSLQNPLEVDAGGKFFMSVMPDAMARAVAGGHDGLIVRQVIDHASPASQYPADVYVAFRPEQIKSATANNGNFDPEDPRIDHAVRDLVKNVDGYPESAATRSAVDAAVPGNDIAGMLRAIAAQEGIDADQSSLALRLADIVPGLNIKLVAAPENAQAAGLYNTGTNELWVSQAVPSVVLHEVLHGVTSAMMTSPTLRSANQTVARAVAEFNDLLGAAQAHFAQQAMDGADIGPVRATLENPRGPLSNIKELLTYGMTDKRFQQWLATVPAPAGRDEARTAWQWFKDAIAAMLGVTGQERSALDALVESTSDLVDFAQANPRAVNFAQMSEANRMGAPLNDAAAAQGGSEESQAELSSDPSALYKRPDINAGVTVELLQAADSARARSRAASAALDAFPKSQMGLTTDEAKNSSEWKAAKRESDQALVAERQANAAVAAARKSARSKLRQGGDNPRGSVTFGGTPGARVFNIELLKGMDASTFMHEMGHVYLEVLNDLAARDGAPAQIVNDMDTLNAWLGRKEGETFTTDQHEQFARGFEAYLREGKAPSSALRRTFAAFKVWLTALYRSVRSLNVELTDDVRGVMDRILASDAEIEDARAGQYQEALITDALAVGMSPEDFERYNEAVNTARADAEATVAAEVLLAERREQQAWYNREKREVRAQVLEEVRNQPVYRVMRLLRNGKLPNGELAPDELRVKLSKEELLDKFGQSFLRNLVGMYSVEGGVRVDEAAAIYGFGSGRELIESLVNAPRLADAVASETDARMKDRHPDPMTDGTLPDRAMIAAHRDRQADVMVREIRALEQHVNGRQVSQAAVIKGVARQIIQGKKLRHLQPATYRAAEAKAGREAFEAAAKQDWGNALAARRRQLLNFELFREAVRSRDEAARAAKYLAKFGETKTRARLGRAGGDYLDQVDGLLDRFDFRKISDKASDRRASLADWINRQNEAGIDVNLPQNLLDEAFRMPYREMTITDLLAVRDAVRSIDHLARLRGRLLLAEETRDAAQIDADMAASLLSAHDVRPITTGDRSAKDKVRQAFMQGRVLQATATDMARELDGFKDQGAIWMNTVGVMRDAVNNRLNPALQQAQDDLANIYVKHYTKAEIRAFGDRVPMPEVNGDLWSKSRLLSLALNWGNAGNREAILTQARGRMSPEQVNALLSKLDSRDWAFVQDVWNLIDSKWEARAEVQRRRTGLVPERVQASAFTVQTSDGKTLQIPGGYYPLKYESDTVRSMKEESEDFYNSVRTGRSKAEVSNSAGIERVGSGGRTVRLDTSVIQQHLRDEMRFVHLGDAVNYVHNVLNGQQFKEAVDATGTQEYRQALEVWLKDAAAGEIGPRVWHERAMRAARQNFTASVLTFKVTSALLQLSGVVPTIVTIGQGHTLAGIGQYLGKPRAMTRYVREASPYMDSRLRTHIEAVQTVMDAEAGRFSAGKAAIIRFGYWMIGRVQGLVDTVTWLAAEQAGMAKFGNDVGRARAYADDVVTRAQGSGEFIDKSPLQRGTLGDNVRQTEWIKATTALQGYMIAKGNLAYEQTRKANLRNPRQAMKWAADMVMLFSVEGLLTAALTAKLPNDDDDDGLWDDLGEWAIKDALATFFGVIPGGGVLVDQFRGYDSSGVVAGAWRAYAELLEKLTPGEDGEVNLDKGVAKAAVSAAGVTLGLPSTQINKTIDAIAARADGRDVSPYEYLTGPKKEPK